MKSKSKIAEDKEERLDREGERRVRGAVRLQSRATTDAECPCLFESTY